jgi:hypothetical protein
MKPDGPLQDKRRSYDMEMKAFVKTALKKVAQKVADRSLDKHEEGYDDPEEMLLDWIWIELKEESPDKDSVINMELDDLYEIIESSAEIYEDYQILLETIRSENG